MGRKKIQVERIPRTINFENELYNVAKSNKQNFTKNCNEALRDFYTKKGWLHNVATNATKNSNGKTQ